MSETQPDFKKTYTEVNQLLDEAGENVRTAESALPKSEEEMKAEIEKMVEEKAEELTEILKKNLSMKAGVSMFDDPHKGFAVKNLTDSFLVGFPPELGEQLLRKLLSFKDWKNWQSSIFDDVYIILFFILTSLGEKYEEKEEEKKREDRGASSIEPLVINFSEEDFVALPNEFGAFLREHVTLTMDGGVANFVGNGMTGGTIFIKGNAWNWVGKGMKGGKLIIKGNAGKMIGADMKGGTINITKKAISAESFAQSAFTAENHGTIIWAGTTLWNDGWTKEGEAMRDAGEIPGI